MANRYHDRLKILEDQEIEELYARPRFNHDERVHFFSLSSEERALADGHYNLVNRVLFILQAGYFKARTLFFPSTSSATFGAASWAATNLTNPARFTITTSAHTPCRTPSFTFTILRSPFLPLQKDSNTCRPNQQECRQSREPHPPRSEQFLYHCPR
jgi:Domain of unknown function (DUF4158)